MKEGRETERQQKKQCRQSKPWTEIGKQWKTRQDKRRNTTGDWQVDIPKTSTSYFCVKTNGNRNRVGLNWWGGQFPWIRWVCEGWYHTNSTSASQNTSWGQHREEQPHRSLWKAVLAPGRSSSRGQVPPALQHRGEIKEIQSTPCAHWVQKNRCQQGAQSWDPWGRMKILSCNCVWNPKIKSCS